jgi:hypothetical protein
MDQKVCKRRYRTTIYITEKTPLRELMDMRPQGLGHSAWMNYVAGWLMESMPMIPKKVALQQIYHPPAFSWETGRRKG